MGFSHVDVDELEPVGPGDRTARRVRVDPDEAPGPQLELLAVDPQGAGA